MSAMTVQGNLGHGSRVQGSGVQGSRVRASRIRGGRVGTTPRGKLRLTRRGRLVVVLTAMVLLVIGFSMGRVSSQAAGPGHRVALPTVTVQPGENLWQLATRVAPHADPRLVVDQITHLNHLSGSVVGAGQQLIVPN